MPHLRAAGWRTSARWLSVGATSMLWACQRRRRSSSRVTIASSDAHFRYSHLLVALGRFDEAIAECRRALELDPLSTNVGHYLGRILYFARRYDQATRQLESVLNIDPNEYWSNLFLSVVYGKSGHSEEAERYLERSAALGGISPSAITAVQAAFRRGGRGAALRKVLELTRPSPAGPVGSSSAALIYAQIGEKDQALAWLQKALDSHTRDLIYVNVEPAYDSLRGDPRFDNIVKRIGFPG